MGNPELPHPHGQADPAGRMVVPGHQLRLRDQIRRQRRRHGVAVGPRRPVASDHHLGARAQGLSLYRRPREQPHRPHQACRTPTRRGKRTNRTGERPDHVPRRRSSSIACCFPTASSTRSRCSTARFRRTSASTWRGNSARRSSVPTILRSARTARCTSRAATVILRCAGEDFAERDGLRQLRRAGRRPRLDRRRAAARLRLEARPVALSSAGAVVGRLESAGGEPIACPTVSDRRARRHDLC